MERQDDPEVRECPRCHGEGEIAATERVSLVCPTCDGSGLHLGPTDPGLEAARDLIVEQARDLDGLLQALNEYARSHCPRTNVVPLRRAR